MVDLLSYKPPGTTVNRICFENLNYVLGLLVILSRDEIFNRLNNPQFGKIYIPTFFVFVFLFMLKGKSRIFFIYILQNFDYCEIS